MLSEQNKDLNIDKLSPKELKERVRTLAERTQKLTELVEIISRGKYMWESTFDAITAPVQIVSSDYVILRANLKFAAVSGKDIAKMIGCKCYEAFAGRSSPCEGCPLSRAIEKDAQIVSTIDGEIANREFEASAYPIAAGSEAKSAVIHYRDITEEKRLQREVIQQEKMAAIGMLAGGVAHEINNPLGGILAFTQLMKRNASDNESMMSDLEEIERAAQRCKKIVADLLDFSRISSDRERTPVDVNVLLEKVFPFLQREMRSFNVELEFHRGAKLPHIMAIPDKLQQVFLNLMTNACHSMEKGGTLYVETKGCGEWISVIVRDNGVGICPTIRDKIFNPFFTTKAPGKGTGLGLSISYRIVKEHGGEISCEPAHEGGTVFTVRLPVVNRES